MADKMTRNVFGVVMVSVWHAVMTLVMLPTLLIQWLTGTRATQPPPRKMAETPQNEGPLTDEETKLLQASWEILAEDKKTNGVKLFMKLFSRFPDSKAMFMFGDVPLEDLDYNGETTKSNRRMVAHAMSVMYALESYIDSLDDIDCLVELVRKTARFHLDRNIGAEQFEWMEPVIHDLIDSVTEGRDNVNVDSTKKAWTKILGVVVGLVTAEATLRADAKQKKHM